MMTTRENSAMSLRDLLAPLVAFQELEHLTGQRFSEPELAKMQEFARAKGQTLEEALNGFLTALRNISQDDLTKVAERLEADRRGSLH